MGVQSLSWVTCILVRVYLLFEAGGPMGASTEPIFGHLCWEQKWTQPELHSTNESRPFKMVPMRVMTLYQGHQYQDWLDDKVAQSQVSGYATSNCLSQWEPSNKVNESWAEQKMESLPAKRENFRPKTTEYGWCMETVGELPLPPGMPLNFCKDCWFAQIADSNQPPGSSCTCCRLLR